MFQLFLRARAHGYFKARSSERDTTTDQSRVAAIKDAIEDALKGAEAEQAGLGRRIDDVLARAAVTFGNSTDEYLERESLDNHHQDLFGNEIANGQRRLKELAVNIGHYKFLKAVLMSRFPNSDTPPDIKFN